MASLDLARELEKSAKDSSLPTPKPAKMSLTLEERLTKTLNLDLEDPTKVTNIGTRLDPK